MPNYEDFKRYGEMEKKKKKSTQTPTGQPSQQSPGSWLSRGLSALKGGKKK
jgi:hypothetical protein